MPRKGKQRTHCIGMRRQSLENENISNASASESESSMSDEGEQMEMEFESMGINESANFNEQIFLNDIADIFGKLPLDRRMKD
jgi:hypothetical protein